MPAEPVEANLGFASAGSKPAGPWMAGRRTRHGSSITSAGWMPAEPVEANLGFASDGPSLPGPGMARQAYIQNAPAWAS
jgi:hypothetical protein